MLLRGLSQWNNLFVMKFVLVSFSVPDVIAFLASSNTSKDLKPLVHVFFYESPIDTLYMGYPKITFN